MCLKARTKCKEKSQASEIDSTTAATEDWNRNLTSMVTNVSLALMEAEYNLHEQV